MPKKLAEPVQRQHLSLFVRDVIRLHQYFDGNIGFSAGARELLHRALNSIEEEGLAVAQARRPQVSANTIAKIVHDVAATEETESSSAR